MISNGSPNQRSISILPLNRKRRRAKMNRSLNPLRKLGLFDQKASHNCLACAGVICEEEAQPRLREHFEINRLDLMRKRSDAGETDGEMPVVGVGQTNTC